MEKNIFRAYDIRGVYGRDFNANDSLLIGKAFATLTKAKSVVVGCDNRLSSPKLKESLINGLVSSGCHVIDIGMVPTPLLYYSTIKLNADGGIMVTASHLTKEYNGFKLCKSRALPLMEDEIQHMRILIDKGKFKAGKGKQEKKNLEREYLKDICNKIKISKKMKIIADTGNGMGGIIIKKLMDSLGMELELLHGEPDGNYPNHHPDPTIDESLVELKKTLLKGKFDIGIAIDGDGDRVVFLDNMANSIRGDQTLAIFSREALERNPGSKILFEVKCSKLLPEDIEAHGGKPVMGRTGHSFIKNAMKNDDKIIIAGEMSSHLFFREFYSIDDAFFASAKMIEITSKTKLSKILESLPKYYSTPEIRMETTEEKKMEIVKCLKEEFEEAAKNDRKMKLISIDGIRVEFPDGWGIIRASNTSPVINLRFEARTEKRLKEIEKLFMDKVNRCL